MNINLMMSVKARNFVWRIADKRSCRRYLGEAQRSLLSAVIFSEWNDYEESEAFRRVCPRAFL